MDYLTFKRHIGKAGLKIGEFARLAGIGARAVSNYSSKGEVPHHHAVMAVCFGVIVDGGGDIHSLLRQYGALPADFFDGPNNPDVIQLEKYTKASLQRSRRARHAKG